MRESNSVATVLQALRHDARRLAPGSRLPSVRALMARHRVSPGTVRQAMARLADEGVLEARPGHGTFLAPRRADPPAAADFAWQGLALGAGAHHRRRRRDAAGRRRRPAPSTWPAAIRPRICRPWTSCRARWRERRGGPACGAACRSRASTACATWFARQLGAVGHRRARSIICPGSQAAIATAFNALTEPGRRCWSSRRPTSARWPPPAPPACGWCRCRPTPTAWCPDCWPARSRRPGARLFYTAAAARQPHRRDARRRAAAAGARRRRRTPARSSSRTTGAATSSFEKAPPRPLVADDRARPLRLPAVADQVHGAGAAHRRHRRPRRGPRAADRQPRGDRVLRLGSDAGSGARDRARAGLAAAPARACASARAARRDVLVEAVRRQLRRRQPGAGAVGRHAPVGAAARRASTTWTWPRRAAEAEVIVSPGRRWFPAEPTGSYLRVSYACAGEADLRRAVESAGAPDATPPAFTRQVRLSLPVTAGGPR